MACARNVRGLKDAFAAKQLLMTEDALRETMGAYHAAASRGARRRSPRCRRSKTQRPTTTCERHDVHRLRFGMNWKSSIIHTKLFHAPRCPQRWTRWCRARRARGRSRDRARSEREPPTSVASRACLSAGRRACPEHPCPSPSVHFSRFSCSAAHPRTPVARGLKDLVRGCAASRDSPTKSLG